MTNPEYMQQPPNLPIQQPYMAPPEPEFGPVFMPPRLEPAPPEQRRQALAMAVANEVAHLGRVEAQSDMSAVIVHGQRCNHTLHLILTLVTCGLWAIVWLILASTQHERRTSLIVDEFGQVLVQRLN